MENVIKETKTKTNMAPNISRSNSARCRSNTHRWQHCSWPSLGGKTTAFSEVTFVESAVTHRKPLSVRNSHKRKPPGTWHPKEHRRIRLSTEPSSCADYSKEHRLIVHFIFPSSSLFPLSICHVVLPPHYCEAKKHRPTIVKEHRQQAADNDR